MNEDYINHLTAKYAAALQNKVAGNIPSPALDATLARLKNMQAGPQLEAEKGKAMQEEAARGGFADPNNYLTDRDNYMLGTRLMSLNPLTATGDLWTNSNRFAGGRASVSMQNNLDEGLTNLVLPALVAGGMGAAGSRIGSPLSNATTLGYNPFTRLALQSVPQQEAFISKNFGYGEGMGLGKELANVKAVPIQPRGLFGALFGKTPNTTGTTGGDLTITQQSKIEPAQTGPIRLIDKNTNLYIGTLDSGKRPFFDSNFAKAAPPHPTTNIGLAKGLANKSTGGILFPNSSSSRAGRVGLTLGLLQLAYGAGRNYFGSEDPNAPFTDKLLGRHGVGISDQSEENLAAINNVKGLGN